MLPVFEKWAIAYGIGIVLDLVASGSTQFDGAALKAKLDPQVAKAVPGTFFDAQAVALVNAVIDAADKALADATDMKVVLEKIAAKDFAGAFDAFKDLVLKAFSPVTEHGHKVVAFLKAA